MVSVMTGVPLIRRSAGAHVPVRELVAGVGEGDTFVFTSGATARRVDAAPGVSRVMALHTLSAGPFVHGGATVEGWRPVSRYATARGLPVCDALCPLDAMSPAAYVAELTGLPGVFMWRVMRGRLLLCYLGAPLGVSATAVAPGVAAQATGTDDDGFTGWRQVALSRMLGYAPDPLAGPATADRWNLGTPNPSVPLVDEPIGTTIIRTNPRAPVRTIGRDRHVPATDITHGNTANRGRRRRSLKLWEK